MQTFSDPREVRTWSRMRRDDKQVIGFVPTMGALHEGHLSLLDTARRAGADSVVASIFVNPTQFAPGEDLAAYPRDLEGDLAKLQQRGVDCVFLPSADTIYASGAQTSVSLKQLPNHLCGIDRPIHFTGVATVVSLLLNIVEPQIAVFGEKDFQQLQVIRQMVRDLWFDTRILGSPIVRELDGLAMSSRNQYLSSDERRRARCLSEALTSAEQMVTAGVVRTDEVIRCMTEILRQADASIQYIRIVDERTLKDVATICPNSRAMLAAFIGKTRLIDNRRLINQP